MAAITDTRLKSGVSVVSVSADPSASTSAPSATTDVSFDKINFAYDTNNDQDNDTDGRSFPVYADNEGNIRAMSLSDMKDTFTNSVCNFISIS